MSTTSQTRLMRTYRVNLLDNDGHKINHADVNLSFPVNQDCQPVNDQGRPITDLQAHAELTARLRRLAGTKRVTVSHDELDQLDWDVRIVRWRFIYVDVDAETGKPVKGAK